MKYYATRTEQAAHGMPERVTVYRFDSKSARAFFLKYGERYDYQMHPRPICEAITAKQDVSDLARLDIDLLRTVREAIDASESQYAPAARERIDAILSAR